MHTYAQGDTYELMAPQNKSALFMHYAGSDPTTISYSMAFHLVHGQDNLTARLPPTAGSGSVSDGAPCQMLRKGLANPGSFYVDESGASLVSRKSTQF